MSKKKHNYSFQLRGLCVAGMLALSSWSARAGATVFIDTTCAQYLEATATEGASHQYTWFVLGFVTGTNWVKHRQTPADAAAYRLWVKGYCERNPFDLVIKALSELDKQFGQGDARVIPPVLKK